MFRNVLVGVDGSPSAARALEQAIDLARASGGRLGLLGVAPLPSPWVSVTPFAMPVSSTVFAAQLDAEAQRNVDEAERTVPADVPVTKLLAHGSAAKALLAHAETGPWDLVMVGHRPSSDHRLLRRGVGDWLLHRSPVPVLVVRSAPEPAPLRRGAPVVHAVPRGASTSL
jgi:nucleotide-binding universal stress UspA family protein